MGNVSSLDLLLNTAAEQLARWSLQQRDLHWDVLTLIYTPRIRTAAGILAEQNRQPSVTPISLQALQHCSFP